MLYQQLPRLVPQDFGIYLLGLELVRENEICFAQQPLVLWHLIFWNIQLAIVAHDRIEHYLG
jgi:hypothetical protein